MPAWPRRCNAALLLRPSAVSVPLSREDRHGGRVNPLVLPAQLVSQDALGYEADLVVHASRPRVEGIDLQRDPVQAQVLEAVSDDQPGRLRAQPAVPSAGSEHGAEVAAAVGFVPLVEDDFADALPAGLVHDGQVEAIWLLIPAAVPLPEASFGCLVPPGHVCEAVQAACEPERLQILEHLAQRARVLVHDERTQHHRRAGQGRLDAEVGALIDHEGECADRPAATANGFRLACGGAGANFSLGDAPATAWPGTRRAA